MPGGHIPVIASGEDYLRVALLQDKKLILPNLGALARLHGATGAGGGQVPAGAVPEGHLARPELQRVAGGLVSFGCQGAIVPQKAVVRGLQVVPLVLEDQGDEGVHAPWHVPVDGDLVLFGAQVRVPFPGHAEDVDLRVHGDVHAPFLGHGDSLSKAGDAVLRAAQVAPVRLGLQGPAAVIVRRDDEAAVLARRLAVPCHVPVLIRRDVAPEVALQEEHVGVITILLKGPDLLLLHACGRGVDLEPERLSRQVFISTINQAELDLQHVAAAAVGRHVSAAGGVKLLV